MLYTCQSYMLQQYIFYMSIIHITFHNSDTTRQVIILLVLRVMAIIVYAMENLLIRKSKDGIDLLLRPRVLALWLLYLKCQHHESQSYTVSPFFRATATYISLS